VEITFAVGDRIPGNPDAAWLMLLPSTPASPVGCLADNGGLPLTLALVLLMVE
jgi:hypothetical protein